MDYIPIAELKPELPALESKQICGVVTLIWPYSSSARQFAFLLSDPNFRRRRKDGQVRVRFSGSSARAIASTNVGIGDEVVLSLRGVEFVGEKDVHTPGRSIPWELAYKQTLSSKIMRNGEEMADLDLINVAPTPAPVSPVRATPRASIESSSQWSSPAFLKRSRFSNGPTLAPPVDPFADDIENGHAKKRRRRSYRDWNAWTYLARTPSPEKEDESTDETDRPNGSPIRPVLLPATPVSPPTLPANADTGSLEELYGQKSDTEDDGQGGGKVHQSVDKDGSFERPQAVTDGMTNDEFVQDSDHYDLDAGPAEQSSAPYEVAPGSDTEPNTDEDDPSAEPYIQIFQGAQPPNDMGVPESMRVDEAEMLDVTVIEAVEAQEAPYVDSIAESGSSNTSGAAAEEEALEIVEQPSKNVTTEPIDDKITDDTQMRSVTEEHPEKYDLLASETSQRQMQDGPQKSENPTVLGNITPQAPAFVMPPPTLSLLQTDFQNSYVPGTLTPIGKEPSSPNLQPLDSSTLPMPSPFPGGRDGNVSSYLDYISTPQQSAPQSVAEEARQEIPHDEADYILETSFYSSVSSYRAPAFHPTHESAFTDVRFTFGMDGAAFSRPQTASGANKVLDEPPIFEETAGAAADWEAVQLVPSSQKHTDVTMEHDHDMSEPAEPIDTFPASPSKVQHREPIDTVFLSSSPEDVEREEQPDIRTEEGTQGNDDQKAKEEGLDDSSARTVETDGQADRKLPGERHEIDDERVHNQVLENSPVVFDMVDRGHVDDAESYRSPGAVDNEFNHTADSEDFHASQLDAIPGPWIQPFADASEVIDLGSPSSDSDENESSIQMVSTQVSVDATQEQPHEESYSAEASFPRQHTLVGELSSDHIEHAVLPEDKISSNCPQHNVAVDPNEVAPRTIKLEPTENMGMDVVAGLVTSRSDVLSTEHISNQEDVKIESIEEALSSFVHDDDDGEQGDDASAMDDHPELLIAVPAEGHKVGELELVSVPDTAPARSTRSKTKTSLSPEKEAHAFARTTRARNGGSLAPLSQLSERALSPPATRSRSIVTPTPTRESFSTSSYSLRSQSKHLSPTKRNFGSAKKTHSRTGSSQNGSTERSAQQASFTQNSPITDLDFPWTNSGPSQELGTLQGKYANVPYVKDSEEGSLYSDRSLSTVHYSDDWNMGIDFSDSALPGALERGPESTPRKPRTASRDPTSPVTPLQNAATRVASTTRSASTKSMSPFATQQPLSSPTKSERSVVSMAVASSSPRRSRRVDKDSAGLRAGAAQDTELGSSPPANYRLDESTEYRPRSPRAEKHKAASENKQSILPMTPEPTQHVHVESQLSFSTVQEQNLPMTPQLTQSTTTMRHSFQANTSEEDGAVAQPASGFRTTPRREAAATDIASPLASHRRRVQSASPDKAEVGEVEKPSVGLSTPIAYYTALKDLPYFLNRSSKFHSAGSPDVLGLVTSASTPPTRATKGPKHHTTSLHITDLSVYPSQTTVQVFRAYADALPVAEVGDVVLLRAFNVKSVNRHPCLVSADESGWCVWRYGKPLWGKKRGRFSEVRSREEVKGPAVERGEGEWGEVEKLRAWWRETVQKEVEEKAHRTRSRDKQGEASQWQS
ncbi:hypothetical protein SLS60_010616 [Paraconiothyrium brasiliense]|uniref:Telomeric single stranded DNA binding POT1/Cdc13 domain-containing protein n=1 Tax=Paraconiothyrium brasiliense TaxID=300254 RepID=A0ABR3QPH5_9PLEO